MSDHEIVWEFSRDHVRGEAVCNAGVDALCRNMPVAEECGCEIWRDLERDEQGWFHTIDEYVSEGSADTVTVKHRHTELGDCNICEWLNNGDLMECAEGRLTFDIARTPIEPVWEGDYYEWKPA